MTTDNERHDAANRCPTCSWPFAASAAEGCIPGNCSYRGREGVQLTPAAAPTPHPLDLACEQLRGLAHGRTVALTVREDGSVTIHRPSGDVEAHLTGADGLPLPSQAIAALVKP